MNGSGTLLILTLVVFAAVCCTLPAGAAESGGYRDLGFGPSYVSNTIPDRLEPGHIYPVMVTFRNAGLIVWENRNHRVGLVCGADLQQFVVTPSFVAIPDQAAVPPGRMATFAFSLLPVGVPGEYTLPFYVSFRTAIGDTPVTEVFSRKVRIVPTDGISSPGNGSIVVESPLSGLLVSLGGVGMGSVPCIIPDLLPGSYEVEVEGDVFRRSFPVDVQRGTLSRVYVDNATAEPRIIHTRAGIVSDGTLIGYIETNILLILIISVFILACTGLMVHRVRVRREEEDTLSGKHRPGEKREDERDPAEEEKDLLDSYHSRTRVFEPVSPAGSPGAGLAGEERRLVQPGRMKHAAPRSHPDERQPGGKGRSGRAGMSDHGDQVPGLSLSLRDLEVNPGFARAHIAAMNLSGEPVTVEGVRVEPGLSAEFTVDVAEPETDDPDVTIPLMVLTLLGRRLYHHLPIPYNRGIALLARGVLEKAYEFYQGILSADPHQTEALLRKARILLEWGLEEEAAAVLEEILTIHPDHEDARALSGSIAIRKKMREEKRAERAKERNVPGFSDQLSDRYTPIRLLGRDAFASIVLAIRIDTGDLRALKIAHADADTGESVYTEISVLYQLRHPNVLKMFRAEFHPVLFLELEYASGISCGERICRTVADLRHPLPGDLVFALMEGIASGVAYLHSRGVRHYHLSPRYILLDEPLVPKISGLMRASLIQEGPGKTDPLMVRAPEQVHPEIFGRPGKRTDIFQLGVIWYWLMTGTLPFPAVPETADGAEASSWGYRPVSSFSPSLAPCDPLVSRLLAPDMRKRYGSADEFLAELRGVYMSGHIPDDGSDEETDDR